MSSVSKASPSFWRFQIVGWAVYALISIPVKFVMFGSFSGAAISLYRELLGFSLTCGMYPIYRHIYAQWSAFSILLVIVALSFVGSSAEFLISFALHNVVLFDEAGFSNDATRVGVLYYRAAVFASWGFLYFGLRLYNEAKDLNQRLVRAISENRLAEAQLLRSQMNPHFLFNALTTIRGSVERSREEFRRIIQSLADYLVYSLDHGKDDLVTLGMEFDATRNYLQVEKSRFQDGIEIECHIEDAARSVRVPGIVLQPLVENAVKYGWQTSHKPLRVRMEVDRPDRNTVRIVVSNSGHWVEPQEKEKTSHLGLTGLRRRLELLYADQHRVEVTDAFGWITITIHIPTL